MGALRVLTEDLEVAEGDEAVLVVDDLHRVDDSPAAQSVLAAFVENKPDALHLVLLGRRRPALPIDRLRATGRLADVTFDVLRFSEEEALEMLAGLCPDTAPETSRQSPSGLAGGPPHSSSPRSPCGPNEPGSSRSMRTGTPSRPVLSASSTATCGTRCCEPNVPSSSSCSCRRRWSTG